MCEAVEKYAKEYAKEHAKEYAEEYAKEYAINAKAISVKNLMENMKLTLEQALDAMGIQGDERTMIAERLQDQ